MSRKQDEREQPQGAGGQAGSGDMAYEPRVNQIAHEPVPASHHDDKRPETVVVSEEYSHGSARARPSRDDDRSRNRP